MDVWIQTQSHVHPTQRNVMAEGMRELVRLAPWMPAVFGAVNTSPLAMLLRKSLLKAFDPKKTLPDATATHLEPVLPATFTMVATTSTQETESALGAVFGVRKDLRAWIKWSLVCIRVDRGDLFHWKGSTPSCITEHKFHLLSAFIRPLVCAPSATESLGGNAAGILSAITRENEMRTAVLDVFGYPGRKLWTRNFSSYSRLNYYGLRLLLSRQKNSEEQSPGSLKLGADNRIG